MDTPIDIRETNVASFDAQAEAAELRLGPEYANNGRSAQTFAKGPDFNVTLVVLNEGVELAEHVAPRSAMIAVIEGEVDFISAGSERRVGEGGSVVFAADVPHSVRGIREAAFLLVIATGS